LYNNSVNYETDSVNNWLGILNAASGGSSSGGGGTPSGSQYYTKEEVDALLSQQKQELLITISGARIIPDYDNVELINRISTNGGTWTVDRDGYVCAQAQSGGNSVAFYVNDLVVIYGSGNGGTGGIIAVSKGDVVKIWSGPNVAHSILCYYIPPKFVTMDE